VEELILDETVKFSERKGTGSRSLKTNCVDVNSLKLKLAGGDEHIASVALLVNPSVEVSGDMHPWYLISSSYVKNIRVVAWIRRLIFNSRATDLKQTGTLIVQEFLAVVMRNVQSEEFLKQSERIRGLVVTKATDGLYHVKTKLTHSEEAAGFGFPVLYFHPIIRWWCC